MKITWYNKAIIDTIKKELTMSTVLVLCFTILFTILRSYIFDDSFTWEWIEPIEFSLFTRIFYSALTYVTIGKILYDLYFYKILYQISGDYRSFKELKRIIWFGLMFFTWKYTLPLFEKVANFILSIGYNVFKFLLFFAPIVIISFLVIYLVIYLKKNYSKISLKTSESDLS